MLLFVRNSIRLQHKSVRKVPIGGVIVHWLTTVGRPPAN